MSNGSRAWVAILLATALLAGCVGQEDSTNETETSAIDSNASASGTENGSASSSGSGQSSGEDGSSTEPNQSSSTNTTEERQASLEANVTEGKAPLPVSFTANATAGNGSWRLVFGDGNETNGTSADLPMNVNHTYTAGGNYTAAFSFTYQDGATVQDQANLTVQAPGAANEAGAEGPTYQPRHKEWTDAAMFGVPYLFSPAHPREEFVKTALDNGANGTFVLGYDVNVTVNTGELSVAANADAVEGVVPDYDMVLYGPDGSAVGSSGNGGTNEAVTVSTPDHGTYTIGLLFWAGADAQAAPQFPVTITADAV